MRYWLDEHDRITNADETWDEFAIANGAPSLLRADVVGHEVWDYIADPATRQLWELLFARAREKGRVHVQIRCDGPTVRRHLLVAVYSDSSRSLEISSEILGLESRPSQELLDSAAPRSPSFLTICSWCKNLEVDDRWVDVEEGSRLLGLLQSDPMPRLTHGICPACREGLMATFAGRGPS